MNSETLRANAEVLVDPTELARANEDGKAASVPVVLEAKAIRITDPASFAAAGRFLTERIKPARKKLDDLFGGNWRKAKDLSDSIRRSWLDLDKPLELAEQEVKSKIGAYSLEQDRLRQARERQERAEAEARRKAEEEERLSKAVKAEEIGDREAASHLLDDAPPVPVAPPPPEPEPMAKAEGVSARFVWRFRVVDEAKIPRKYLAVDEKKIGADVKTHGPECGIPGIEVYKEAIVSGRAKN